jgi:hypothetical protein
MKDSKETHRVWVWSNQGQHTLKRGSRKACRDFRKSYTGYRKEDMYITKIE